MKFLLLVAVLIISGCSSKALTTIVQEGDKITTTLSGAAVQRDVVYAQERQHRDSMTYKMYKQSGVNLEMELYTYTSPDGKFVFTTNRVKNVSAKAPNRYQQNIESRPPDHRGWKTLDKALGVVSTGVIGYFLNDAFKETTQASGNRYYGDYNPQTAEPYIVEPYVVEPFVVTP